MASTLESKNDDFFRGSFESAPPGVGADFSAESSTESGEADWIRKSFEGAKGQTYGAPPPPPPPPPSRDAPAVPASHGAAASRDGARPAVSAAAPPPPPRDALGKKVGGLFPGPTQSTGISAGGLTENQIKKLNARSAGAGGLQLHSFSRASLFTIPLGSSSSAPPPPPPPNRPPPNRHLPAADRLCANRGPPGCAMC